MKNQLTVSECRKALYNHESHEIRFICNVLESCSNSAKKTKGLYKLVFMMGIEVTTKQFSMFQFVTVHDGMTHEFSELESVESFKTGL